MKVKILFTRQNEAKSTYIQDNGGIVINGKPVQYNSIKNGPYKAPIIKWKTFAITNKKQKIKLYRYVQLYFKK